jgi:hypothetical protein
MHSTRYKPRYGLLMAHRSVPRTMTLNDNPGGEIEGKITRGEEAYELLAAAYKGGVNVSAGPLAQPPSPTSAAAPSRHRLR